MCTDDISVLRSIRSATYRPSIRHEIDRSICVCVKCPLLRIHMNVNTFHLYTAHVIQQSHSIPFDSIPFHEKIQLNYWTIPFHLKSFFGQTQKLPQKGSELNPSQWPSLQRPSRLWHRLVPAWWSEWCWPEPVDGREGGNMFGLFVWVSGVLGFFRAS